MFTNYWQGTRVADPGGSRLGSECDPRKKSGPILTHKKPNPILTHKKPDPILTHKKPDPILTQKKPDPS